jgi:DNA-directed RNA polymerase subunit RPC12/RpoP
METIVISCPDCEKQIKAPGEAVGKKIRCKACGHVFVVKAPPKAGKATAKPGKSAAPPKGGKPAKPATPAKSARPADDDLDEDGNPYGVTDVKLGTRCPQCASEMTAGDVICLACGYNTETREQFRMRKVKDITGGDKFLWLLPGILCILAVILMIAYLFFHHFALPGMMFDNWDKLLETKSRSEAIADESIGALAFLFHPGIELWIAVMLLIACYKAGRFAVRRLIFNPNPPEVEYR